MGYEVFYEYAAEPKKDKLTLKFLKWPRQNFFLQYQYNIKQKSDENKE